MNRISLKTGAALAVAFCVSPVHAQQYPEIQVTSTALGDIEFDWGRDGVSCPSCNYGEGNSRLNWTDRKGNLWIGHLDPNTGGLISPGANDELADTNAFFWNVYGNGPEWAFSTQQGHVASQLVYTRHQPGEPAKTGYAGAAFATMTGPGVWAAQWFPGAYGKGVSSDGTNNSDLPEASQCNSDPVALGVWKNFATPQQVFTEPVSGGSGTTPTLTPFGPNSNGIGERFVPCTHQLVYQGAVDNAQGQVGYQQVFWYDLDSQVAQQLTTDPSTHSGGFMFQAPDFSPLVGNSPNPYILVTIANHLAIQVYEQSGTHTTSQAPIFQLVNTINSPDPNSPYINSAEPFINCTPACTSYMFMTIAKTSDAQKGVTTPIGLAVAALKPASPLVNILAPANYSPAVQRLDPEYFITANGVFIYYNQIEVQSGSTSYHNNGEFYIDAQLGVPSGPCVGSSAEGGLNAAALTGPGACVTDAKPQHRD